MTTKRIILAGDVFDSFDFRRLKKSHWKVLWLIRKMSDSIEITWINGNHDGPAEFVSHLLGGAHENGIQYFNSGSWTERPCHYLTVREGQLRLHSCLQTDDYEGSVMPELAESA